MSLKQKQSHQFFNPKCCCLLHLVKLAVRMDIFTETTGCHLFFHDASPFTLSHHILLGTSVRLFLVHQDLSKLIADPWLTMCFYNTVLGKVKLETIQCVVRLSSEMVIQMSAAVTSVKQCQRCSYTLCSSRRWSCSRCSISYHIHHQERLLIVQLIKQWCLCCSVGYLSFFRVSLLWASLLSLRTCIFLNGVSSTAQLN